MPDEGINPAPFPEAAFDVWGWFLQISRGRQSGINGPMALSSTEILAFFQLEGCMPDGWELGAIRALDMVALESMKEAG